MESTPPQGPFCQSCGKPFAKIEEFGIDKHGHRNNEYCVLCYSDGHFTEPDISMTEMVDRCVSIIIESGMMDEAQARAAMNKSIPRLKRWRSF